MEAVQHNMEEKRETEAVQCNMEEKEVNGRKGSKTVSEQKEIFL